LDLSLVADAEGQDTVKRRIPAGASQNRAHGLLSCPPGYGA